MGVGTSTIKGRVQWIRWIVNLILTISVLIRYKKKNDSLSKSFDRPLNVSEVKNLKKKNRFYRVLLRFQFGAEEEEAEFNRGPPRPRCLDFSLGKRQYRRWDTVVDNPLPPAPHPSRSICHIQSRWSRLPLKRDLLSLSLMFPFFLLSKRIPAEPPFPKKVGRTMEKSGNRSWPPTGSSFGWETRADGLFDHIVDHWWLFNHIFAWIIQLKCAQMAIVIA